MEEKEEKDSAISDRDGKERGEQDKARQDKARKIFYYYKRKDIQKAFLDFSRNREVVPRYQDSFGKRPDILQYENDIASLAEKGMTSLHCSEELWKNPLELKTEMSQEELNSLREGWDLLLDIDSRFIEYSKITAQLLIEALQFHNVNNVGLKFSGGSGFHILVPWKAFPSKINKIEVKDFFPAGPRIIASYLKEMISNSLREKVLHLSSLKEIAERVAKPKEELLREKKFNPYSILEIDTVLISSRHLFRMPYSLHEKTGLASIVIRPEQLASFHLGWAKPSRIFPKPFMPEAEENEAKELLVQALDWHARKEKERAKEEKEKIGMKKYKEIVVRDLSENLFPPCITLILKGMKHDGRKRALFVLLNFFKSLGFEEEEIKKKIEEWNKKNYKPLREGYIVSQLSWFAKRKSVLPPNCDKTNYKDIAICQADNMCRLVKNPVNYVLRKARFAKYKKQEKEKI